MNWRMSFAGAIIMAIAVVAGHRAGGRGREI